LARRNDDTDKSITNAVSASFVVTNTAGTISAFCTISVSGTIAFDTDTSGSSPRRDKNEQYEWWNRIAKREWPRQRFGGSIRQNERGTDRFEEEQGERGKTQRKRDPLQSTRDDARRSRQGKQVPRDRRQAEKKQWNIRQRAKMGGDTEKENEHERVLPLEGRTLQIWDRMHILSRGARRKSTTRREKTSGKMLRLAGRIL